MSVAPRTLPLTIARALRRLAVAEVVAHQFMCAGDAHHPQARPALGGAV